MNYHQRIIAAWGIVVSPGHCFVCVGHAFVSRRYSPLYERAMELNKRDNFKMRLGRGFGGSQLCWVDV